MCFAIFRGQSPERFKPKNLKNHFWRRAHMSSLSGGARRARGARPEKGQPTGIASAHPIHHQRACNSNRDEGGYCVDRPKKGLRLRHRRAARGPEGATERENAPRFEMQTVHRLKAPLAGHCFKVAAEAKLETGSSHQLTPKACRA